MNGRELGLVKGGRCGRLHTSPGAGVTPGQEEEVCDGEGHDAASAASAMSHF